MLWYVINDVYKEYLLMSLVILLVVPLLNNEKMKNLQGSVAQEATLVYTLHWGSTQGEVMWTPHLLYILPMLTKHPMEARWLWVWAPLPVCLSTPHATS